MESLQFQKAEFSDPRPKCVACRLPIDGEYFQLSGKVICAACAERVRMAREKPPHSAVMRGLLYGAGAAIVCAVGYAILTATLNIQFALAAILVGYLVGRAVRIGSGGLGGRRCQIIAVLATYFAITISYTPIIYQEMKQQGKISSSKSPAQSQTGAPAGTAPKRVTIKGWAAAYGFLALLALLSPFLEMAAGLNGIIGIVIIVVGLLQAWRQTARDRRPLMGPYPVEGSSAGASAGGMSNVG